MPESVCRLQALQMGTDEKPSLLIVAYTGQIMIPNIDIHLLSR
jgi:hypothetical protein